MREHETNRRIAYDEFLIANGVERPSNLIVDKFPRKKLIYFLANVCIPEIMDISFYAFPTSRSLDEERINVCLLLSQIDPENSEIYNDEIKNLTKILSIEDGLRDVDRSRVHVNIDAIASWAHTELGEQYQRYKDLLRVGVGFSSTDDFDSAVRQFNEGDENAAQDYLDYPDDEGDHLLLEMVGVLETEYLTNPNHGLDAYLSMRVRHGSLAGRLRGPLEDGKLISRP